LAAKVVVAHPGQLRLIFRSKRKSDRVDAEKLAKLLFLDEVPPVWVPSGEVQGWRSMIERRQQFVGERTRAKNRLRALLKSEGMTGPKGLWTKRGLAWLEAQSFPTAFEAQQRDLLVQQVAFLNGALRTIEGGLAAYAARHSGVQVLLTIPGVGIRTAEAVVAYIDDPDRFRFTKAIGSYFGLVPCQDESGGRNRLGHITRQGPATVRKLLTEAVWQAIRWSPEIRAYFQRLRRDDPDRKKIAVVATAHYLLRVMLAMLRTGEVWRYSPAA
jgi:transposase